MADDIEARVKAAILRSQQDVDPGQVTPEATFEELGMTSLDALALVMALEEEFGVDLPNEEAIGLRTVGEAVDCVRRLIP